MAIDNDKLKPSIIKPRNDLSNHKFGHLTVIKQSDVDYVRPDGRHEALWDCICDCGNTKIIKVIGNKLKSGRIQSCGCIYKEQKKIAGIELKKKYPNLNKKYNKYKLDGEYGVGITSNTNKEFYFDLEDFDKIKNYCWYEDANGYVAAHSLKTDNRNGYVIFLHRLIYNILDVGRDIIIDHIQHNKLDNRKSTLRIVNSSENSCNRGIQSNNTSGITGVYFHKPSNSWCGYINIDDKQIRIYTNTKEEAVIERRKLEDKYFGEYSYNNSINRKDTLNEIL